MKELIEIDKLKKWRADRIQSGDCNFDDMTALEAFIETVERVADAPQGEWIAKTENYHSHWVCSECGSWALLEYNDQMCLSNFCPNCGCRMKGADDE